MKISELKRLFDQYHLSVRKTLGQNFLIQEASLQRIASFVHSPLILEIGPGCGGLTLQLAALCPKKLVLVEKDRQFQPLLQTLVPSAILMIDDALCIDWSSYAHFTLVGNLPYAVSVPILFKYLATSALFTQAIFMFQKEVAQRIMACPGTKAYGRLSVMAQTYSHPVWMMDLPASFFWPRPQVDSTLLVFTSRLTDVPYDALDRLVSVCFQQRRKMIHHALQSLGLQKQHLEQCHIAPSARAEDLSIHDFARLVQFKRQYLNKDKIISNQTTE